MLIGSPDQPRPIVVDVSCPVQLPRSVTCSCCFVVACIVWTDGGGVGATQLPNVPPPPITVGVGFGKRICICGDDERGEKGRGLVGTRRQGLQHGSGRGEKGRNAGAGDAAPVPKVMDGQGLDLFWTWVGLSPYQIHYKIN